MDDLPVPDSSDDIRETTSLNAIAGNDDPFPFLRADETRLVTSVGPDEGWAGHPNPPESPAAQPAAPTPEAAQTPTASDGAPALPDPLPVTLNIWTPEGTQSLEVEQPRLLLGRRHCDLEFDDPYLDAVHLQLFADDGRLMVADIASDNGVFLRIADDLTMADGDEVLVGNQRLRFRASWATKGARNDETTGTSDPVPLGASPAGPPARLERVLRGGDVAAILPIEDELTIGRETGDLTCPEDVELSDPHTRIVRNGDTYTIRDLDSERGTFIRIHDRVELVDGDCFAAGRVRLEVEFS